MQIKLLTTKEVAEILRCVPEHVSKLCQQKKIVGTKTFGGWKIPEEELYRTIEREINREKVSMRKE